MRLVQIAAWSVVLFVVAVEAHAGILDGMQLGPKLENVERLLLDGEYEAVNRQYLDDNKRPGKTYGLLDGAVKFLKEVDRDYRAVHAFDVANIASVRPSGDGLLIGNRSVQLRQTLLRKPEKFPPFSAEFLEEINRRLRATQDRYNVIVAAYNDRGRNEAAARAAKERQKRDDRVAKEQARAAEREREEERRLELAATQRRERARDAKAREERLERLKAAREAETVRLNQSARAAGYDNFEDINILAMLAKTQRDGGLERYVGKVIGCGPAAMQDNGFGEFDYCERWYPKIRIIQVGGERNLFQFHTSNEFAHSDKLFLVFKEAGKLYQEGQRIEGRFHTFVGMHTYTTALGASRTVPVFKRVDL